MNSDVGEGDVILVAGGLVQEQKYFAACKFHLAVCYF